MIKRITATVLAASIALTSVFVAPVRAADRGEIVRGVLGAGVLLYLGNELSKNNRNNGHVTRRDVYRDHGNVTPRHRDRDYRPRGHRKVVPSACLRHNQYRNGPRRYFGRHCLSKNMRNYGRLPGYCQTSVNTRRGWRTVYAARCLRQNGWTFG